MGQVVGGQLDFGAMVLSSAAGSSLRILGLFAERRNPATPDTPTVKEQGFAVAPSSKYRRIDGASRPATRREGKARGRLQRRGPGRQLPPARPHRIQPDDYLHADGAAFATNLTQDVEDKRRLLKLIGEVK